MTTPLIIPKKGEERLLLLFAALLVIGGVAMAAGVFSPRRIGVTAPVVAGYILIGLGALCLPWALSVARKSPKALVLSSTGFFDPQLMRTEIPWQMVTSVDVTNFGKRLLNVRMDPSARKQAGTGFLASALHGITGGSGIAYQARSFPEPLDEVAENLIAAYRAARPVAAGA